ncbi:PREDICTED: splicing factor U2af 38 kDa subunit [Drosophila arizonae]|uniref:Splicing factor U2af 38 kDa subunit n=1 Tax=Drosophila arizonae TaxID=7263 RepID=A0ABM1NPV2_DROAR|nr:PREDICTED: splicing factor U2af 38 kDa subunit [Drosophila arizonae]
MAEYLASIFGTEKDKVNCSFYFKIGACRHGDRCSRIHNKPTFSQTVLLQNLYVNPQNSAKSADGSHLVANVSDEEMQEHYDNFFEDVFVECEDKYGEIEEMNVCDNLGDHLVGNVYIKFRNEADAEKAANDLNNRWFGGRPVYSELSPVTDFREACCRQYEMGECTRSGFCNFMHLKPISRELRRYLYSRRRRNRSRSRSRSGGPRRRSRSRSPRRRREDRGIGGGTDRGGERGIVGGTDRGGERGIGGGTDRGDRNNDRDGNDRDRRKGGGGRY